MIRRKRLPLIEVLPVAALRARIFAGYFHRFACGTKNFSHNVILRSPYTHESGERLSFPQNGQLTTYTKQ
jgi:hypothetical protein